jgi:hypothetical protein
MQALLLRTNGAIEAFDVPRDGLPVMQKTVGGWIELIPSLVGSFEHLTIFGNEEAKILELPANWHATELSGYYPSDIVCGDVIVLGPADRQGETTGLSDSDLAAVMNFLGENITPGVLDVEGAADDRRYPDFG